MTSRETQMTPAEREIVDRLDRLEIAVGQIASAMYGPSVGGSHRSPLMSSFVSGYERRRDQQFREARVAQAEDELAAARKQVA